MANGMEAHLFISNSITIFLCVVSHLGLHWCIFHDDIAFNIFAFIIMIRLITFFAPIFILGLVWILFILEELESTL